MIKAILFDIDDTLYDHTYHVHTAVSAIQTEYEFLLDKPIELLTKLSHEFLEEVHALLLKGELTLEEARFLRWQKFLDQFGVSDLNPTVVGDRYLKAYYEAERVVPGSHELLSLLSKDFKIGVVSNNLLVEQMNKLNRLGLSQYIDFFAISEEVGVAKPDKKIFEVALERGAVNADEAIMIGDSWMNDVVGAIDAGIKAIWYNPKQLMSHDASVPEIQSLTPPEAVLNYIRNESPTPVTTSTEPARL
ncbi:MAG: HAD family hydrolase [bacterium]